jgi:hypothetical protein
LLTSSVDVGNAFSKNEAPAQLKSIDFTVDRIVLGSSNPSVRFAVDDGLRIVVGQVLLCQGVAPECMAYVVRGSTRNELLVDECPYAGSSPCLAP